MKSNILLIVITTFFFNFNSIAQTIPPRVGTISNNININRTSSLAISPLDSTTILNGIHSSLFGTGVTISNLKFSGSYQAIGLFDELTYSFGIGKGIIIATGSAANAIGPNNSDSEGIDLGINKNDSDLASLTTNNILDLVTIEFDFISAADTIFVSTFVFGSEEYPEYVNSPFNDVFGFFISGPGINGTENLAKVPGTNDPIAINSVNSDSNSAYFHLNDSALNEVIQYDGLTVPVILSKMVFLDSVYHFKIAIADVGDGILDSGVLIEKGSFTTALPTSRKGHQKTKNKIEVYPNPSSGELHINGIYERTFLRLYDLSGKLIFESQTDHNTTLDGNKIEPGIYILGLSSGEKKEFKKIIITR